MRANAFRRIAADLTELHESLPPNYLFPENETQDDLSSLDILLVGPSHTPFSDGVWRLHFDFPPDYPQKPPTANFRTTIFHPNVDSQTGSICVETLKRDWNSTLTLRHLLVTISCLLIQPNPDSALNAEAGALIQQNYDLFARRARLMTSIHAVVPLAMREPVRDAQSRGQETNDQQVHQHHTPAEVAAQGRRRRPMVRQPRRMLPRRSDGSPIANLSRRRQAQTAADNPTTPNESDEDLSKLRSDDTMSDDQENDPVQARLLPGMGQSGRSTPRRPPGPPAPLGELSIHEDSSGDEMEVEYPPSPRKSPRKNPASAQPSSWSDVNTLERQEPVPDFLHRNFPTPATCFDQDISFATPTSPRKGKERCLDYSPKPAPVTLTTAEVSEQRNASFTEEQLWNRCGHDVGRWNRCIFDGQPFDMIASRW